MRLLPARQDALDRLGQLFEQEVENKFAVGDQLRLLTEAHGFRIKHLAVRFGRKANRLSEIYRTAKAFPPDQRNTSTPFSYFENARACAKRFDAPHFPLAPDQALAEIISNKLGQRHEAARHFKRKLRAKANADASAHSLLLAAQASDLIDRCHHADYRNLRNRFAHGSIKVIWADPPYSQFRKRRDGGYCMAGVKARTDCDHADGEASLDLTLDLLRSWQPTLAKGGCLLLWQGAGPLRLPILRAVEDCGWQVAHEVIWDKGHPKPGNVNEPYMTTTERLWIVKRAGDLLRNHDSSSRADIIRFSTVRHRATDPEKTHIFQKPQDLCRFLIEKHSYEGELIFDAMGCSGSASIAAIQAGRRFVYCESNEVNYAWGYARVKAAMDSREKRTA